MFWAKYQRILENGPFWPPPLSVPTWEMSHFQRFSFFSSPGLHSYIFPPLFFQLEDIYMNFPYFFVWKEVKRSIFMGLKSLSRISVDYVRGPSNMLKVRPQSPAWIGEQGTTNNYKVKRSSGDCSKPRRGRGEAERRELSYMTRCLIANVKNDQRKIHRNISII